MFRGLTKKGANYLATRLANALPVQFTKVKIGSGIASGNPEQTTELNNYIQDAKILSKKQEGNAINITIQITNENREQGFYLKEIGVYVNDNDTEVLYWYCNEDNAQYVPAKTDSGVAFEIDIKMEVTNQESTIFNWSGKDTWIDLEHLNEALKKKEDVIKKGSAFNKNYGITKGTTLEGDKYSVMEGIAGDKINPGFIQDSGEKKENKFYLDKNTGRLYRCLKTTQSTTNSTDFFRDVSLANINDKLDNLWRIQAKKIFDVDLNNISTPGIYVSHFWDNKIKNSPSQNAFILLIFPGTQDYVPQIFFGFNGGIFSRNTLNSQWKKLNG